MGIKLQGLTPLLTLTTVILAGAFFLEPVNGQWDPHFTENRTTIVHLFEWRWNDIAEECERFLGPYGFGGIQTSPPNENVYFAKDGVIRPWYERYQPVSYKLETRSGTEQEFASMVRRCNAVGVRIYIDAVINHMTYFYYWGAATGTAGSQFHSTEMSYPAVPYTMDDFNTANDECPTASGEIVDINDIVQARNCRMSDLNDLNQRRESVRKPIVDFFNKLVGYGVAGFRIDASKHIWVEDLEVILGRVNSLPVEHGFPSGARPVVFHEVIEYGGETVHASDYFGLGRVTEFKAGAYIQGVIRKLSNGNGNQQMSFLRNWGPEWSLIPDGNALTFVDNHDNQRGVHGGGIITFRESKLYKITQAFFLAWPYGVTRIMSSYYWEQNPDENGNDRNNWFGPPHDNDYNILPVAVNQDLTCGNGWMCEHRWRPIYNMVRFRNVVKGTAVENWWDNGKDQIAFSRGNKGFIAINNDVVPLNAAVQTGLPGGTYCDTITGNLENGRCTGKVIEVGSNGVTPLVISNTEEDPMIAIHINAKL